MATYEPVTITWPDGSVATFSRAGNIVTVTATPATNLSGSFQSVPVDFRPAGESAVQVSPESSAYRLSISASAYFQRFFPGNESGTWQYLADAEPVTSGYPTFDVNTLADFSGNLVSDYTNMSYVTSAISQAILLFKLGTCLGDSWPTDPTMASLASNAINAMADAIYSVQAFQRVLANPFSSETIGSYSYSKVAGAVMGGLPTGISWFDIAISKMSVCELNDGISMGGGIEVFEFDGAFAGGYMDGNIRLLSPRDLNAHNYWLRDPSEGYPYTS